MQAPLGAMTTAAATTMTMTTTMIMSAVEAAGTHQGREPLGCSTPSTERSPRLAIFPAASGCFVLVQRGAQAGALTSLRPAS